MRSLTKNKTGALYYIQVGIVILILSALAIPIVGSVMSSIPANTIDAQIQTALGKGATYTPTANVTAIVVRTSGTVLGLNPLAALIAVAAGMISLLIGAMFVKPSGGL
jgi:energy-converting hydrogenase Eha subunit C